MIKDLRKIIDSINPDNIKNIPFIKDATDIFIQSIEELASESKDMENFYKNDIVREELLKIYLDDLYKAIYKIQTNQKIADEIVRINEIYGENSYISSDALNNISAYFTDEHFLTFKSYKEAKGNASAIKYIYELVSSLFISPTEISEFSLKENGPFSFDVSGSLPATIYDNIVRPLAHPLGFVYDYQRMLQLFLQDYFPAETFIYNTSELYVNTLFPDGSTTQVDFLYDGQSNLRTVILLENTFSSNIIYKRIYFDDGDIVSEKPTKTNATYLEQRTTNDGQTTVFYMQDVNGGENTVIQSFLEQSSIYHVYEFIFETTVQDNIIITETKTESDNVEAYNIPNSAELTIATDTEPTYGYGFNPSAYSKLYELLYPGQTTITDYNGEFQTESAQIPSIIGDVDIHNIKRLIGPEWNIGVTSTGWVLIDCNNGNIIADGPPPGETYLDINAAPTAPTTPTLPNDWDGDGIVNTLDPDDDNDGLPDFLDPVQYSPMPATCEIGYGMHIDGFCYPYVTSSGDEVLEGVSVEFVETIVAGDAYSIQYFGLEDFDCGVYRNGARIADNNVSSI